MPGESSSVVTCLDGHQMARKGQAGAALAIAALGSFFAGTVATILVASVAMPLSELALKFGPAEYFSLMVLGLIGAVVLAHGSLLKAIAMIILGLLLGIVGTDVNSGVARFAFGIPELTDGIGVVTVAMGLFGFAEIISNLEVDREARDRHGKVKGLWLTKAQFSKAWPAVLRGTGLGSVLGVLPGGGAMLSSFASYTLEKKLAKDPSRFGKGAIEGVAGPESANNAGAQTSFIPLLTLGIPENAVMALMVGAMTIHNIQPGPQVMTSNPALFWGLIASMWVGNLMLVVLNLPLIGIWVKLLQVPYRVLYPAILLFCSIGVYSINNTNFDVMLTALFGFLGVIFVKLECEPAPLLLGFVLGPMMEENLRRALLLSRGDPTVFFTRPLSARHAADGGGAGAADRRCRTSARHAKSRSRKSDVSPHRSPCAFDWRLPYPSRRQPIFARNVVATSQPLATQAGIAMLQRGGNAVDAALATAIALTVVEPCSNGIGSDLFAIVWDGRELVGLNASGPRAGGGDAGSATRGQTRDAAARLGSRDDSRRRVGLGGAVAALRRAAVRRPVRAGDPLCARRLRRVAGRRREMGARGDGAAARPRLRRALPAARPRAARGRVVSPARRWRARSRSIAATHGNAFYRGELAHAMVAHAKRARRAAHARRFRRHTRRLGQAARRSTIAATTVHEIPPNGQGIAALMALGILRAFDLAALRARFGREPAPADRGDEARVRRRASLRQRSAHDGGHARGAARPRLPRVARAPDRSRARAGLRPRRSAARRHRLPLRRRRARHDRVADPVELHGLRLRRRRSGHRHQPAEPRRRLLARSAAIPTRRRRQAAVPHDHSRLPHARRRAARGLRRDGRPDPAAGPRADDGPAARPTG